MPNKKIIENVIVDVISILIFVAFALVSYYFLHDNVKCICMTVAAMVWVIRTIYHLTKLLLEKSSDEHNKDN